MHIAGDNIKHTVWLRIFNEACHARCGDRPPPVDRGSHKLSMKPPIAGGKGVWASYEPPMFGAIGLIIMVAGGGGCCLWLIQKIFFAQKTSYMP